MTNIIPCEDAYAQERSLLSRALECIARRDCILADRNFCTTGFLFGIRRREAFFVIRQHASTLSWELQGKRRLVGKDRRERNIYEQAICMTDPEPVMLFVMLKHNLQLPAVDRFHRRPDVVCGMGKTLQEDFSRYRGGASV